MPHYFGGLMFTLLAQASTSTDATGVGFALLFGLAMLVGLYFLPIIIALLRKAGNSGSVIIINVLLGWTFVGWVVALAMAFGDRRQPVQVNVMGPSGYQQGRGQ
jgi:Superinfection immunity protein